MSSTYLAANREQRHGGIDQRQLRRRPPAEPTARLLIAQVGFTSPAPQDTAAYLIGARRHHRGDRFSARRGVDGMMRTAPNGLRECHGRLSQTIRHRCSRATEYRKDGWKYDGQVPCSPRSRVFGAQSFRELKGTMSSIYRRHH